MTQTYDYVVVGAGAAGAPAARRLADAGASVCLIEGGPSDREIEAIHDIRHWDQLLGSAADYDFAVETEPDGNPYLRYAGGRTLGGSSSINNAIALRPPADDLVRWEEAGAAGWGPGAVEPSLTRVEQAVPIAEVAEPHPAACAFVDAARGAGYETCDLGDGCFRAAVGWMKLNATGTARQSSAVAYLRSPPPTLEILANTRVRRVAVSRDAVATGVETERGTIAAVREVILAAGALATPKLLMLSGIGPAPQLRGLGIDLVTDLRGVGEHLLDHPDAVISWRPTRPLPPSTVHGWEAALTDWPAGPSESPVLIHFSTSVYDLHTARRGYPTASQAICMVPFLCHPRSSGTVRLRGSDPRLPPVIAPRPFSDTAGSDVATMAAALGLCRRLAAGAPLNHWLAEELAPGGAVGEELTRYVRATSGSMFHPAGTCRMGSDDDAVTQPDLRVSGVQRLRIADASIFPEHVSVNPCVTCMMIGERCAELILDQRRVNRGGEAAEVRR